MPIQAEEGKEAMWPYVVGTVFVAGAALSWGIVAGAARLRTPEEQAELDEEQMREIARWAEEHGKGKATGE